MSVRIAVSVFFSPCTENAGASKIGEANLEHDRSLRLFSSNNILLLKLRGHVAITSGRAAEVGCSICHVYVDVSNLRALLMSMFFLNKILLLEKSVRQNSNHDRP